MTELFFRFGPYDEEIGRKIDSLALDPMQMLDRLLERAVGRGLPPQACDRLRRLHCRLETLPFDTIYPGYLTHPLRVAASYLPFLGAPGYDDLAFALCHNIDEAAVEGVAAVRQKFLSPQVCADVRTLTIDRARERDPAYLREFYDGVEQAGRRLLLFKSLDKLDNFLWYVRFDVETYHYDVVLEQVCPRIASTQPHLERYLRGLIDYVRTDEARAKFRR